MDCCHHDNDSGRPGHKSGHDHSSKKISAANDSKVSSDAVLYTCPMHPEVISKRPGMCPECGMQLVPASGKPAVGVASSGGHGTHDKHAGHKTSSFIFKFWIAFILTIPLFLYSEMATEFGITMPAFEGSAYLSLLLGTVAYFYCGWIFLASAYREMRARLPGMMTLIALAITSAYAFSVWTVLRGTENSLFWELSSLIAIMLLGHWIEMRSVQGAQGALRELAKLLPDKADVERDGKMVSVPVEDLKHGDMVVVKPGGKIPADGRIAEGRSDVNESLITGESKPVSKKPGDEAVAGSLNGDGALKIVIEKTGEETFLAGVMRLVADAQASKSRLQVLSDKAALVLTVIAIVAGGATFAAWLWAGAGATVAIERLVAVLVITCPHALGLAIPLVSSISTTMGARNGVLVRERRALESARNIDTVLFDKTGTLTTGEFTVTEIMPAKGFGEFEVVRMAAAVNALSEHPLAKAMVTEAERKNIALPHAENFERLPGKGARAKVFESMVTVGNDRIFEDLKTKPDEAVVKEANEISDKGMTVVHVVAGEKYVGSLALADAVRAESKQAVAELKGMGMKTAMITGDSEDVAARVANELGIDEYFARVMPAEKADKVKSLQSGGRRVAMVGDGVNDAPALTQADLGVAIGAGTNVAIESAGIILVKSDPGDIAKIVRLSRLTYRKMIQNLIWATGYNVVALPLAAGVLAYRGIGLEPAAAAVLMSASTVIVAFNAVLMRRSRI